MMSKSYTNLQDLASGNFPALNTPTRRGLSRVMSVPGSVKELDDDQSESASSDNVSSVHSHRIIIVANQLPLKAQRRDDDTGWDFSLNEDSLLLQLKDGFPEDMEVLYVGSLKVHVNPEEEDAMSDRLLDEFNCVPTFVPLDLWEKFYHGFCKRQLWPLFHYLLPYSADQGGRFDRSLWEAYVSTNILFYRKIIEVLNPEDDFIWIHDYHLMVLPNILRRRFLRVRMGFFLHSPFPSSEIYRTLPVGEEILKTLLNSDIIGFHTFDYARHFLSCCSRMLGLNYQSKRGYLGLEYYGRTIGIKIMPVGVHRGRIESVMKMVDEERSLRELKRQFLGKRVIFGIDDLDIFKGINLKLLAMEQMLKQHPSWQGKAVLVQVINPARGQGISLGETWREIQENYHRIDDEFGQPGYKPVVLIDRAISVQERVSYFNIADCVAVTAVRDGMNLVPYEYIVCRQGLADSCSDFSGPKKSMLVVSEFVGCSPSLSGAIRVNPWNVETTAEALSKALSMRDSEQELRHEKHYRYVSTHDVAYWSRSFLQDLERACADHFQRIYCATGFSFGFRVVAFDPNFRKLPVDDIVSAYIKAKNRAILLDYDGTVIPQNRMDKTPSEDVISILKKLCSDKKNMVFIVSGRGKESLNKWLSPCQKIGIAAEHGYFLRWPQKEEWEVCGQGLDFSWMKIAEPVMKHYTEATDGSSIEAKESALVWKYMEADQTFGSSQAKEILDHLENVLANEPVAVKRGRFIVEVKPQIVSKGIVAEKILASMAGNGRQADFVLCIGDDRSDEDMFEIFSNETVSSILSANTSVFACTVGQTASKARFFLDDTNEVINMLKALAEESIASPSSPKGSEGPK